MQLLYRTLVILIIVVQRSIIIHSLVVCAIAGCIVEHPETQMVTAGEWANFTCSINCSERVSLRWRLVAPAMRVVNDDFSLTKRLMRVWGKKGVVIQSEKSESDDFKSVTLYIQAPSTLMNGAVLQCGAINSRENVSCFYSKFAILLVEEESPELGNNDNIVRGEESTNATTTPPSHPTTAPSTPPFH